MSRFVEYECSVCGRVKEYQLGSIVECCPNAEVRVCGLPYEKNIEKGEKHVKSNRPKCND
jgi:hypothetical protein